MVATRDAGYSIADRSRASQQVGRRAAGRVETVQAAGPGLGPSGYTLGPHTGIWVSCPDLVPLRQGA